MRRLERSPGPGRRRSKALTAAERVQVAQLLAERPSERQEAQLDMLAGMHVFALWQLGTTYDAETSARWALDWIESEYAARRRGDGRLIDPNVEIALNLRGTGRPTTADIAAGYV